MMFLRTEDIPAVWGLAPMPTQMIAPMTAVGASEK